MQGEKGRIEERERKKQSFTMNLGRGRRQVIPIRSLWKFSEDFLDQSQEQTRNLTLLSFGELAGSFASCELSNTACVAKHEKASCHKS